MARRVTRNGMGWRLAVTTTIALAFVTTPVLARRSARLVYSRAPQAESCPVEADLRSAVATRLGYEPFEAGAPAPAIGAGGFIGLGRGSITLDLEGRADFPASLRRDDGSGVSSSLVVGTVAPCGHLKILVFCGTASAGALHGEGLSGPNAGPAG